MNVPGFLVSLLVGRRPIVGRRPMGTPLKNRSWAVGSLALREASLDARGRDASFGSSAKAPHGFTPRAHKALAGFARWPGGWPAVRGDRYLGPPRRERLRTKRNPERIGRQAAYPTRDFDESGFVLVSGCSGIDTNASGRPGTAFDRAAGDGSSPMDPAGREAPRADARPSAGVRPPRDRSAPPGRRALPGMGREAGISAPAGRPGIPTGRRAVGVGGTRRPSRRRGHPATPDAGCH